jgi:hypothetical protein
LILEIGDHREVLNKSRKLFDDAKENLSFLSKNFVEFLEKSFVDISLEYILKYHSHNL